MQIFNHISDFLLGRPVRNIASENKVIYLTFDDGPNSHCTPHVLALLKKHNAKATFFVITKHIAKNIEIFNRITNEGHSIGNHSPDHDTRFFIRGKSSLRKWIDYGEATIQKQLGKASVGFRPPVGIRTPELRQIMNEKNEYPIMWQHRFYDTKYAFLDSVWKKKFSKIRPGDIILLHDTHINPEKFLSSLENFILQLIDNGFQLHAIPYKNPSQG